MSDLNYLIEMLPLLNMPELIELLNEVADQIQIQAMQLVQEE